MKEWTAGTLPTFLRTNRVVPAPTAAGMVTGARDRPCRGKIWPWQHRQRDEAAATNIGDVEGSASSTCRTGVRRAFADGATAPPC